MLKRALLLTVVMSLAWAAELPSRRYLNLAAIKTMVAAAEAEALKRNVEVTICILDENSNILFLQKADKPGINTITFAMKKARHAATYGQPSKAAQDRLAAGNMSVLAMPDAFPNQGGLPIKVEGKTIGAIACSGAASEIDEAISQAAIDALLKK